MKVIKPVKAILVENFRCYSFYEENVSKAGKNLAVNHECLGSLRHTVGSIQKFLCPR
jgi:hypothetical protein